MTRPLDVPFLGSRAVIDLRGRARILGSLWRNQPAVVVWLRHFACLFCKEQAAELSLCAEAIEAEGARIAFVGSGNTLQAQHFHQRYVSGCAVFTDPSAYTYRAVGARHSMAATVGGTVAYGARAMRKGHFQYSFAGRPFQNGGVMIALPGDVAPYLYLSRVAGDHPPSTAVMTALRQAVAGAAAPATPAPLAPPTPPPAPVPARAPAPTFPRWPVIPPGQPQQG